MMKKKVPYHNMIYLVPIREIEYSNKSEVLPLQIRILQLEFCQLLIVSSSFFCYRHCGRTCWREVEV